VNLYENGYLKDSQIFQKKKPGVLDLTPSNMMKSYVERGHPERAIEYFKQVLNNNEIAKLHHIYTYNTILHAYVNCGKAKEAVEEIWDRFIFCGDSEESKDVVIVGGVLEKVKPNLNSYDIVINGLRNQNEVDMAERIERSKEAKGN